MVTAAWTDCNQKTLCPGWPDLGLTRLEKTQQTCYWSTTNVLSMTFHNTIKISTVFFSSPDGRQPSENKNRHPSFRTCFHSICLCSLLVRYVLTKSSVILSGGFYELSTLSDQTNIAQGCLDSNWLARKNLDLKYVPLTAALQYAQPCLPTIQLLII